MKRWPTEEELKELQEKENERAHKQDDFADPICDCGEPGWACQCEYLAEELGYYPSGEPYERER